MRLPTVSIVIAVNRYMPHEWLQALASQLDVEYDVVIVDAQLFDDYGPVIERCITDPDQRARLQYLRVEPSGRAAATNRGLDQATGEVILFLGDDQFPDLDTALAHARFHAEHPDPSIVGIGPSVFAAEHRSRFALWLDASGLVYGVPLGDGTQSVPEDFFCVANASVKRSFLDSVGRFEERFADHAWDDFEFGLRLHDAGMVARLVPDAATVHHHAITLRERSKTMRESGAAARVFEGLRPGPHPWAPLVARRPSVHRLRASLHLARYAVRRDEHSLDRFYRRILDAGFSAGYRRARAE